MNSDLSFCVGIDEIAFKHGLLLPIYIDFQKIPHLLIAAPSGSGKSYLLKFLLQQLAQKNCILILADFKGIDFCRMKPCNNYYQHTAVGDALDHVFQELQNRMANSLSGSAPIFFVVDEWSGYLGLLDKKSQESRKQQMASILMLGRGVGIFLIMALQRADSAFISGRDNFGNRMGLGRLSSEAIRMLFETGDEIVPKSRGKGYLRTDGMPLKEIIVPKLRNEEQTMQIIYEGLCG